MAGALVGGAFLSAFLQVAFDRMASPEVLHFIRGRKLNGKLLEKLKVTLLSINVVLNDAEEKQFTDEAVKMWLDELKDAVYEAEDVLDEIATEASISKLDDEFQTGTSKVWNFISTTLNPSDKGIEQKVQQILVRLEDLEKQKYVLALKDDVKQKPGRQNSPTSSLVEESSVCGRDNDKETIMNLLLSDDASSNKICVITIVGLGGLGKTTLAQFIYNDNRVKEFFQLKAWVCVSEEFDVLRVTQTVYEAVTSSPPGTKGLDLLQVELKEKLMGKKFLLVLDDVWNENYVEWEKLRTPFNFGAQGSKIIVTTRNERVASIMRTIPTYHLKQLSDEDCWLLFANHAFYNGDSGAWPTLEATGREIVKKCEGLPLAAKTLGGLLRTEQDPDEWEKILKSEIWDLPVGRINILPVLLLSFHHLPSHLKRCFAYCSIFPKDYEFIREELILLWMAEDFLNHRKRNKTMEEVGAEYFDVLISRSFFQRSHGNESHFVMHDLVNDLAKYVSGEFCFKLESDHSYGITKKTRHLSYFRTNYDPVKKFEGLYEAKCLRTFMQLKKSALPFFGCNVTTKVPNDLLPTLSCLRVLSLSEYDNIHELPDTIGNLKHLRYLNLSGTKIKCLPDSICDLYNLQMLNISNCGCLTVLPVNIGRLINLHHLDIKGTKLKEMPLQIGRLKNLQTLTAFFLSQQSGSRIKELKEFQHLRGSLRILGLQNVIHSTDALEANIKGKKYLEELELEWGGQTNDSQNERDVLDKLQPHTNLKKLSIAYFGSTRFPDWLGDHSFTNIVSLQLQDCKHFLFLPPLGQLPSLKDLCIVGFDGVVSVGLEFCGISSSAIKSFGSLEILKFVGMLEWQEWFSSEGEDEGGAFPRLRELHVKRCPKLTKGLPNHLPKLTKLEITECQKLVATLPRAPATCDLVLINCNNVLLKDLPTGLQKLTIGRYDALESLPTTLQSLAIKNCGKLEFPMHHFYVSLESLIIDKSCDSLRTFSLDNFPKLSSLEIINLKNLESISFPEQQVHHLMSLSSLLVSKCHNFESFRIFSALNLTLLGIYDCEKLKLLPEQMHGLLPSLQCLQIQNCPEIESFPEGGLPPSLITLSINNCDKLIASRMRWGLQRLPSFRSISIRGRNEELESFPEEGLLPCTVTDIAIANFLNLKAMDGKGLQHLTSLWNLFFYNLPKLQSIPEEGLPTSISILQVHNCPSLKQRCQRDRGEDWPKIANVPFIYFDDDVIIR